jgi:hypothetical protein
MGNDDSAEEINPNIIEVQVVTKLRKQTCY